jgi:hypothetical protein
VRNFGLQNVELRRVNARPVAASPDAGCSDSAEHGVPREGLKVAGERLRAPDRPLPYSPRQRRRPDAASVKHAVDTSHHRPQRFFRDVARNHDVARPVRAKTPLGGGKQLAGLWPPERRVEILIDPSPRVVAPLVAQRDRIAHAERLPLRECGGSEQHATWQRVLEKRDVFAGDTKIRPASHAYDPPPVDLLGSTTPVHHHHPPPPSPHPAFCPPSH